MRRFRAHIRLRTASSSRMYSKMTGLHVDSGTLSTGGGDYSAGYYPTRRDLAGYNSTPIFRLRFFNLG